MSSIILSKTQFLSNIFPIPKNIEKQLHKLIFKYIRYYEKTKLISRTMLYLPKEEGEIEILQPNLHNRAIRTKHIMNLKNPKNPDTFT